MDHVVFAQKYLWNLHLFKKTLKYKLSFTLFFVFFNSLSFYSYFSVVICLAVCSNCSLFVCLLIYCRLVFWVSCPQFLCGPRIPLTITRLLYNYYNECDHPFHKLPGVDNFPSLLAYFSFFRVSLSPTLDTWSS